MNHTINIREPIAFISIIRRAVVSLSYVRLSYVVYAVDDVAVVVVLCFFLGEATLFDHECH